jgi:UTP--glucose-1-phosphate uridylyltransferase
MKAVVPAAGLGSRMLPATKAVPKPMLPVVDRPTIQHVVEEALAAGPDEVCLVVGPHDDAIVDHLDRREHLEDRLAERGKEDERQAVVEAAHPDRVTFVSQPEPEGLGDAVLRARDFVGSDPFLVLCADDVIPTSPTASRQLVEAYRELGASVFGVRKLPREELARYGAVAADPLPERAGTYRVHDVVEKPDPDEAPSRLSTMGRYLFTPAILDHLEATDPVDGELELSDAMARMAGEADMYARRFEGERYDVGTPAGFVEANLALALRRHDLREEVRDRLQALLEDNPHSDPG